MFTDKSTPCVTTSRVSWAACDMDKTHPSLTRLLDASGIRGHTALANALGVAPQNVTNWSNRGVSKDGALAAQSLLGVSSSYVLDGYGPKKVSLLSAAANDGWEDLKAYSQAVGLSDGAEAQEYAETHSLKFRSASLARKRLTPSQLHVMYGSGDSMEPRIHSGDAILFDVSDTRPRDGHIYVIMVPGAGADAYTAKRCEIIGDMVFFRADNPSGDHNWRKPKRMDDPKHPIKIIGRVRWIGSWEG